MLISLIMMMMVHHSFSAEISNIYSTAVHFPFLNNCEHLLFSHGKELNVVIMVITLIYAAAQGVTSVTLQYDREFVIS